MKSRGGGVCLLLAFFSAAYLGQDKLQLDPFTEVSHLSLLHSHAMHNEATTLQLLSGLSVRSAESCQAWVARL